MFSEEFHRYLISALNITIESSILLPIKHIRRCLVSVEPTISTKHLCPSTGAASLDTDWTSEHFRGCHVFLAHSFCDTMAC